MLTWFIFLKAGTRYFQLTNLIDWTINIFSLLLVVDVENSAKETGFREVRSVIMLPQFGMYVLEYICLYI